MALKTATRLLDCLVATGVAVEVTRRSKRRLFGLKGMASLAAARPTGPNPAAGVAGRWSSRWKSTTAPPLAPIERRAFDYHDLESGMAQLALVIRRTRRSLEALVRGNGGATGP